MQAIPRIVDGQPAVAETYNAPLEVIEQALNDLDTRLNGSLSKPHIVGTLPCASSVGVGDIVYWNSATGCCSKALAVLSDAVGANGQCLLAESAHILGMVVSKPTSGTGTIQASGICSDSDLCSAVLGNSPATGLYYLSSVTAGSVTQTPTGYFKQPVLTYAGGSTLVMNTLYHTQDNHYHMKFNLASGWTPVGQITEYVAPLGATYGYDIGNDNQLKALGGLTPGLCAIFDTTGILRYDFQVTRDTVWYTGAGTPPVSVMLFTQLPVGYGSAVVRGIQSNTDKVRVQTDNGVVVLNLREYLTGTPERSRYAISGLTNNTAALTPVISDMVVGPGLTLQISSFGVATLNLVGGVESLLDAQTLNFNSTQQVSEGIYTYIQFPGNSSSSLVAYYNITELDRDTSMDVSAFCTVASGSGTLGVELYFIPEPTSNTAASLPGAPVSSGLALGAQAGKVTYSETAVNERLSITGPGTLIAKLSRASGQSAARLLRVGFKLYPVESALAPITENDHTDGVVGEGVCASSMTKGTVVWSDNGVLKPVYSSLTAHADKACGVLMSSALTGTTAEYLISGVLYDSSFAFSPNGLIYIGNAGSLTQSAPVSGFVQKVGVALTSHSLLVSLGESILL